MKVKTEIINLYKKKNKDYKISKKEKVNRKDQSFFKKILNKIK